MTLLEIGDLGVGRLAAGARAAAALNGDGSCGGGGGSGVAPGFFAGFFADLHNRFILFILKVLP